MGLLKSISASEAKAKLYEVLDQAKQGQVIQVIRRSRPEAVVMGIEKYQGLLERLKDLEGSLDLLKARLESEGAIPWEEVKEVIGTEAGVQG